MVKLEDSSPLKSGGELREPLSSTPEDNKPCEDVMPFTPINPPPPPATRAASATLPRPLFSDKPLTFSTKKEARAEGRLTGFKPPPRPPPKSCPPKSRVFASRDLLKAQAVSFLDSQDGKKQVQGTPLNPKLYDTRSKQSYFQQAFAFESEVGRGCFGTVYRVRSKEDGRTYAVKIANEKYRGYKDRDMKLEEVRKHQFLPSHPNCVRFHSSWEEEGRLYQQFELCNGNLKEFADEHDSLSEGLVWGYLIDLLQAVRHLHNHNLVHMDIKPDNIFFGVDGRCKLGDFGLIVDLINENSKAGWREGDAKYLAPEVLEGTVTKACDVFSLGLTILELACDLDLPHKGHLWTELRTLGPDPGLTMQLSPELRRVIQLMMTADHERRPSVDAILELPSVARAARRREREILLNRTVVYLFGLFQPVILLVTWLLGGLEKMLTEGWWRRLSVGKRSTNSTPVMDNPPPSTLHAVDAFSDDEDPDCTVSSAGSELAAPLQDSSTASSANPSSPAAKPAGISPIRRPLTSPSGLRLRPRTAPRTPGLARRDLAFRSPSKRLFLDGLGGSPTSKETKDKPLHATGLDQLGQPLKDVEDGEEDSGEESLPIAPQNLAKTFDWFSDDE